MLRGEDGLLPGYLRKKAVYFNLIGKVKVGGGLIQKQELRPLGQNLSYKDQFPLPLAQGGKFSGA